MTVPSPPAQDASHDTAFDFTSPRKLHCEDSPSPISSFEEPVRQILEDMREQRMSLCQSLRQYVFVHNAIIDGALKILDEELDRANLTEEDFSKADIVGVVSSAASEPKTGKRGASPTELPKEDKKGEVALAKRPSIKRGKSTSSGESTGSS